MSNEQLIHIFDDSTCLTKKQMKSYVSGVMTNEEAHAVEVHLNSCPLCNDAIDGLFAQQEHGLADVNEINSDFLKDHFGNINPQIHLNSITATHTTNIDLQKKKEKVHHLWRTLSIAAGLLLLVASVWYYRLLQKDAGTQPIAQELTHPQPSPDIQTIGPKQQPIAMNTSAAEKEVTTKPESEVNVLQKTASVSEDIADAAIAAAPAMPATINKDVKEKKAMLDEVAVAADKVSLRSEDERKAKTNEEIEKMPTRSIKAAPATSGQTSFGNSYNADAATMNAGASVDNVSKQSINKQGQADKLYEARSYANALNIYTQQMRAVTDKSERQQAAVGAAKCYIALGNKVKAKEILKSIVDEGGPEKRTAKRLLKELE